MINGADEETRTPDPRITNALLYQLSYIGTPKVRLTAWMSSCKGPIARGYEYRVMKSDCSDAC